jgi:hypothetical protein
VADRDRTLIVAIAGIAATAVVGLAGTGAAWLNGRSDRTAQRDRAREERAHERDLARDERTYDRRVSVYLAAIDYLKGHYQLYERIETLEERRERIPWAPPPVRLETQMRAFGSASAAREFGNALDLDHETVIAYGGEAGRPGTYITRSTYFNGPFTDHGFRDRVTTFYKQARRFETIVHEEIG